MDRDLRYIRRGRDVRKVRGGPSWLVAEFDESDDETVEAKGDVRRGERKHEDSSPKDDRRDLARAAKAKDVDV